MVFWGRGIGNSPIMDECYEYHIIITRVNPPQPPIAHIVIMDYEGYAGYNKWDIRGVYQMAEELIVKKGSSPHPLYKK